MDSLQFAILVIIHQVSQAGGAVNITFDGNGYIGQSIVLQCKTDAASIVTPSAVWYFNNNVLLSTSSGRYTEIRTSDGFNLTVSDLTTADEGYYRCRIDFGSSSNKTLGILYNTSIHITDNPSTLTVTITIIAYPAPTYDVILRENGTKINVLWNSTNITLSNGAINITQINWSTLNKADYSLTVNVTSPVAAFQLYLVKFAPTPDPVTTPPPANGTTPPASSSSSTTTLTSGNKTCELELGLGIGLGLGIPCVITCIVAVIFVYKGDTYAFILGLLLGLGLFITFHVGWIIIVSLTSTGNKCKLELGLGLGLGSGMPWGIACIVAVILVFFIGKGIPSRVGIGKGILISSIVYLIYKKLKAEPICEKPEEIPPKPTGEKKPEEIPLEPADKKNMTKHTGPPAIHIRTQNRVESEPTNKKTSDRPQPLPPVGVVTEDISKHRPQPRPPENSDVKDPNKRGISANFDDKQGLPTEPPRSSRLPPLTPKQPTVEEEEPKKKRKKKKKGQINEETQAEEMEELQNKTTEDQFDGD